MRVEQIADPVQHGEGPVWHDGWGGFRYVDIPNGDVLSLLENGRVERVHVGRVATALRPRVGGGAVIAVERGFVLQDPDGGLHPLGEVWNDPRVRMNDGGCDPAGRFYCGSMAYDQRPGAATLYRMDPDRSVRPVLIGVTVSNGLAWSPDGSLAYYNDTPTMQISVFDWSEARGLSNRRVFTRVGALADGLTVDAEGAVWTAIWNGSAVRRYLPDGRLDAVIEVPTRRVTACTFGGPDLDQLYITTSREQTDVGDDPLAGALFRVDVGVRGLPAAPYAG